MSSPAKDLAELNRIRGEVESLAAGLDEAAFLRRPAEGQWSVGECISHLNAAARTYLKKVPTAVAEARKQGITGDGPDKRGLIARIFVWAMEPPSRVKVKSPKAFLPRAGLSKDETMREFRKVRDELGALMESSSDLDWSRVKMGLPTIPSVKLRLGEIYAVLLAHERRHLWQMHNVLASLSLGG